MQLIRDLRNALLALSYRPFCSCDGQRVSLRYLTAECRYTAERGDRLYQRCLATTSRRELWHTFRTTMRMILASSWVEFLLIYLDEADASP